MEGKGAQMHYQPGRRPHDAFRCRFTDKERLVGEIAKRQAVTNPKRTILPSSVLWDANMIAAKWNAGKRIPHTRL